MTEIGPSEPQNQITSPPDRTTSAKFRTALALDRTTLAWIRTTLTMATFGFGSIGYFRTLEEKSPTARTIRLHQGAIRIGTTLVVLGLIATVLSGVSHWWSLRKLERDEDVFVSQPAPGRVPKKVDTRREPQG